MVELTRLGDVVSMIPAIRSIAKHFADAQINLLVDIRYAQLFSNIGLGINVIGVLNPDSTLGVVRAIRKIRGIESDLVCSMSPPKRNALVVLSSNARFRLGYLAYVDSHTPFLVRNRVESFGFEMNGKQFYEMENIEERSLKICYALGIEKEVPRPEIQLTASSQSGLTVRPGKNYIVLHPFSGWKFREWGLENFRKLAEMTIQSTEFDVVFLSNDREAMRMEELQTCLRQNERVMFFSSADLNSTAVILRNALLAVCNDSGPLHLAAALGVPTVGLFGPADPELTAPRYPKGKNLFQKVDCSPCDQKRCVQPDDHCMKLITPESVLSKVVQTIAVISPEKVSAHV